MTTNERGVVDRIIDDFAGILVGDDEAEHHVPVRDLPDGTAESTWLWVRRTQAGLTILGIDSEAERRHEEQTRRRLDRIRQRRRGGRFER